MGWNSCRGNRLYMPRAIREAKMAKGNASASDCRRLARCLAALLLFAGIGYTQTEPAASISTKGAAAAQGISYSDGQLTINVLNTTLSEVLRKVASLTGVVIDLPAGAGVEKMQIVELGPGPARQILASLLSESSFDYLIQSSDNEPERIQSVLLMPRGKKDLTPGGIPGSGNGIRGLRAAVTAAVTPPPPPEEPPAPEPPAPAAPDVLPAGLTPVDPSAPPPQPQVPAPPAGAQPAYAPLDPSALPPPAALSQPLPQGLNADPSTSRPGALTPPTVMNQQTISQQLQQMYQTRVQMNQVGRQ
jgi:hypothetical protein